MTKTEPYLEHIESEEIDKLVHRLYHNQPDASINHEETDKSIIKGDTLTDSHDEIVSEVDKLLENVDFFDSAEQEKNASLPEFPNAEKQNEIKKPKKPEKKRGFFSFFKK